MQAVLSGSSVNATANTAQFAQLAIVSWRITPMCRGLHDKILRLFI